MVDRTLHSQLLVVVVPEVVLELDEIEAPVVGIVVLVPEFFVGVEVELPDDPLEAELDAVVLLLQLGALDDADDEVPEEFDDEVVEAVPFEEDAVDGEFETTDDEVELPDDPAAEFALEV